MLVEVEDRMGLDKLTILLLKRLTSLVKNRDFALGRKKRALSASSYLLIKSAKDPFERLASEMMEPSGYL